MTSPQAGSTPPARPGAAPSARPGGSRPARPRRPLGRGLTVFLVVDAVLVVVLVVLAGMALADRDATPQTAATGSVAPEQSPDETAPTAPTDAQNIEAFALPSKNIWCEMTSDSATCTIRQFSYDRPEAPEDCDGVVGNVVRVTAEERVTLPCTEESTPTVPADLPLLDYGEASTVGEMTCQSSRNGAFCRHNPSGVGFSLARAGYREF